MKLYIISNRSYQTISDCSVLKNSDFLFTTDINECDSSTDKCKSGENKRCRNLPGDYECICKSNYYKIDGSCKKGNHY